MKRWLIPIFVGICFCAYLFIQNRPANWELHLYNGTEEITPDTNGVYQVLAGSSVSICVFGMKDGEHYQLIVHRGKEKHTLPKTTLPEIAISNGEQAELLIFEIKSERPDFDRKVKIQFYKPKPVSPMNHIGDPGHGIIAMLFL